MRKQMVWSLAALFLLVGTSQALVMDDRLLISASTAAPETGILKKIGNPQPGPEGLRRNGKRMQMKDGMGFSHPILMNAEVLELSQEQVGAIRELQREYGEGRGTMRTEMHRQMLELQMAIMDPAISRDALRDKVEGHQDGLEALVDNFWAERQAVIALLTGEQRERLRQLEFDVEMPHGQMPGAGSQAQ